MASERQQLGVQRTLTSDKTSACKRYGVLAVSLVASLLLGCSEPARFDAADPLTGTWIGSWDGEWIVMFIVKRRADERYEVIYKWEEHKGQPYERNKLVGKGKRGALSFGGIVLKLDKTQPDSATAKGRFKTPRSAVLVRIDETDESMLTVSRVSQLLASAHGSSEARDADTVAEVCRITADILGVQVTELEAATSLSDLGADELDIVEVVMALEEHFEVQVPDEAITGSTDNTTKQVAAGDLTMSNLADIVEQQKR